jgi:hypothetical protein
MGGWGRWKKERGIIIEGVETGKQYVIASKVTGLVT